MSSPVVSVTVVTYNSARFIGQCLQYVLAQTLQDIEVIVVDNASSDETPQVLRNFQNQAQVVYNKANTGFAGGQNQAIQLSRGAWVLTLNPDVRLSPDFLSQLLAAAEGDGQIGTACGKLLAMQADFKIPEAPVLDSTGIYFTPSLRHFDRGSKQPDRGQYQTPEYVFGATGAAALYRREMIKDVALNGDFFDSDFFAYREDADVAWRAQLLGWKCIYTPDAIAYHVRSVLPANRRSLPAIINMHSVKNRFLMRINNITWSLYKQHFWAITFRDAIVVAGCLLREWSSLRAFIIIMRVWRKSWGKRQEIMRRRRVNASYMAAWFAPQPVSFPTMERIASR
ncbi:MAG: glycosyltransferase family 2 protein [Acidobacteriaceae bacterium]|nr:glycosyltransferase family 2 protein [Acidobacteriaceae bacterium]